ncbi:hypothetical protein DFH07DRAFT_850965 [Mycena maculata]|uniref:DUF6533 domain-containing protein n=1 Tax=Mycena maculata TaxID=230809 RepID=A0AAD7MSD5_9AGAR|nr:hypothetical protein DFH07DRAFT_850965 [Mycena maculata]
MNAAEIQSQLNSNYYFNIISFTLLFYDYFLTLDWEISRYWGTPFSWPSTLFFLNRYGTLLGNIPVVIQYFWSLESTPQKIMVCLHLESYHQYFIIATQLMVGVMLILRTHALYERNRRVLILMLAVAASGVVVGLWSVITGKTGNTVENLPLYFGCNYAISQSQGVSLASAWAGVAVFDCMIFLLTLYKVFSRRRTRGTDLFTVLLRDGSVYFGVMVMSNLSNILSFVLGSPYTRGIATTWTNIISSIMISRLMLNLRDPALAHMTGRLSTSGTITGGSVMFAPSGGSPVLDTAMDIELVDRQTNSAGPRHVSDGTQ